MYPGYTPSSPPGRTSVTLRRHEYAILLAAIVGVALVESFSHRLLLGPVASDLAISTTQPLVFLIVFDRRVHRLWHSSRWPPPWPATGALCAAASYPQVPLR